MYIMSNNNVHEVTDCSHMASGELKDAIEERRVEAILG
jgi:hypothetical protein